MAENKLSPSEKEDEKVDHLINKETPKSRKHKNRRGPKFDNRKRRIVEDDKDLNIKTVEGDRDMSLNYKYSVQDRLSFVALALASDLKPLHAAVKAYEKELRKSSPLLADEFLTFAQGFYIEPAEEGISGFPDDGLADIQTRRTVHKKLLQDLKKYLAKASPENIVKAVSSNWPNGDENDYGTRAAIIGALRSTIDSIALPESLKVPFLRKNVKEFVNDEAFIRRIIEGSKGKSSAGSIDDSLIPRFAQLAAAYQMVSSNPGTVNPSAMSSGIDSLSETIISQYEELSELNLIMEGWHDAVSSISHEPQAEAELGKSSKDYDEIISSIDSFFKSEKRLIDLDVYIDEMAGYANENYGGVPPSLSALFSSAEFPDPEVSYDHDVNPDGKPVSFGEDEVNEEVNPESKPVSLEDEPVEVEAHMELEGEDLERVVQYYVDMLSEALESQDTKGINKFLKELYNETQANLEEDIIKIAARCVATSNERFLDRNMSAKTASFHGLLDQKGNPVSPTNTGFKSYDKRFFGKDHYDSILKVAKDFMKDNWTLHGWDGGSPDAPIRAALDLAIHTADDSLYQSKIDVETYNLLLNKLASWGYDTFSDTLLPYKKNEGNSRSASMRPEHQAILKIANDIRETNPLHSMAIMKNLRALASEDPMSAPPEMVSSDPTEITFQSMGDSDFAKLRTDIEKSLEQKFDSADIDAFLEGFDELFEGLQQQVATCVPAGVRALVVPAMSLSALARVSAVGPVEIRKMKNAGKSFIANVRSQTTPQGLLLAVSRLARSYQQYVGSRMVATVPLSDLVRFAHANPSARPSLLPLLAARREAHLAREKKSKKKVSLKKKDEKADKGVKDKSDKAPSGKMAPPFKKGEKGPKKGKDSKSKGKGNPFAKKATCDASDLNW